MKKEVPVKRVAMLVLFGAVVALTSVSAGAAESGKGPCAQDREKFCKDAKPGGGELGKCLKEHESELSEACKQRLGEGRKAFQDFRNACGADAKKLCSGTKPGRGGLMACLKEHESELSDACKTAMSKHQPPR